ncbi:MAG: SGNH/GDSL hydrolase family protein [Oscillospiraceae bacterium]
MKYIYACAALAVCVLLSGCASADSRPVADDERDQELMSGLVTGGQNSDPEQADEPVSIEPDPGANDYPAEVIDDITPVSGEEITTSQGDTTAEVTVIPDADNDFDIFYSEVYEKFAMSEEELNFLKYSLIVGDSICSGFSEYGIVSRDYVAAKGNLGSRSFFEYTFKFRGREEQSYDAVLKTARPRFVFLSMGMNDVNMVDEETYCENYRRIIDATLEGSNAEVFVAAITPVCSKFCGNSVIDSFNDTMREYIAQEFPERVHFFDFGQYLKNDDNKLRTCLHSGDGVHLGPYCYRIALWEMHRALTEAGLWDGAEPLGTFEEQPYTPEATAPVVTTAATTKATKPAAEPEETSSKPKQTTAKTTAGTTKSTQKPKPSTTKATTSDTTKLIPVDETQPIELPQPTEQPEISSEPEIIVTLEAPPDE